MFDVRILCFLLLGWAVPWPAAADPAGDDRLQRSREMADALAAALKDRLQQAMSTGGPVHAVETCKLEAGAITDRVAAGEGWAIRRTSLRTRNPQNVPDRWERAILEQFESRRAAGEKLSEIEHHEVRDEQGRKVFRWMKAIPTGEVCVTCHGGANVSGDLEAAINRLYPDDQARGFKPGDIRGAFSVRAPAD